MDHVIESMNEWIRAFDDPDSEGWTDDLAISCIKNAKEELLKYYHYE